MLGPGRARSEPTEATPTLPFGDALAFPPQPGSDGDAIGGDFDARPLLGRQAAQRMGFDCVSKAFASGTPRLLELTGERGSGKTRMLIRLSEIAARAHPRVSVQYAACDSRNEGPYAPFSRLLLERFGITPASSLHAVRSQMTETVAQVLGADDHERVAETTHLLGHIAGVPFPDAAARHDEGGPAQLREAAVEAFVSFLAGEAQRRPLLLLLDDIDRAEGPAWDIVHALLCLSRPLCVVATTQASVSARFPRLPRDHLHSLSLQRLTASEVEQLLRELLPTLREVPEALPEALLTASDGNPGQLLGIIQGLEQSGIVRACEAGLEVDLARLSRDKLPLNPAASMRARLSVLTGPQLRAMRHAALVGERFWDGALLALARAREPVTSALSSQEVWTDSADERSLATTLAELEQLGFIELLGESPQAGRNEYTFQTVQERDYLYSAIDDDERRHLHGVVAHWLDANRDLPVEGIAALAAPHLERAGHHERAAIRYLEAADNERQRMRTTMALHFVERALSLIAADDLTRRVEALHQRGSLLTVLGRYDDAYETFAEVLRLAFGLSARSVGGAALNRMARVHRQRGEHDQALSHLRTALALFRSSGDQRGVASTFDDMAQVHRLRGDLEPAFTAALEALDIRTHLADQRGQAVSLNTIGYIELDRGRFSAAERSFNKALELRNEVADHEGLIQTRIALGRLAYVRGQLGLASELYQHALANAREMDNQRFQSYLLNHIAEVHLESEQLDEAERSLDEAHELAARMRDQRALADIERNRGLLSLRRGDDDAERRLQSALELAQRYGTREAIAMAHRSLGRLRASRRPDSRGAGGNGEAEQAYRECMRVFRACGNRPELARTQAELGLHLIAAGNAQAARAELEQARETMQQLHLPDLDRIRETLATL